MASLTLFVTTHTEELFELIPQRDYIVPILLGDLALPERFRGELLAESRLFLSPNALDVDTEFVGIVSSQLEAREPRLAGFDGFEGMVKTMNPNSFWAPRFRRILTKEQLSFWISSQDGVHPGMAQVLSGLRSSLYSDDRIGAGVIATGNQFVLGLENWRKFVHQWRAGLAFGEQLFGLDFPYDYRCWNCSKRHPDGFWRYKRHRHLSFFGERLSALNFAHQSFEVVSAQGLTFESHPPSFVRHLPNGSLGVASSLINPYFGIRGGFSRGCDICKETK